MSREERERLAVDARAAIQSARFLLDYREPSPQRAVERATVAAIKAEEFRRHIEAEAEQIERP